MMGKKLRIISSEVVKQRLYIAPSWKKKGKKRAERAQGRR